VSLLALVVVVKLPSCKKINDKWKTFTIKEGKHRSTYALNYSKDTVFGWNIEFDSSAIYKTVDSLNQYDINKLIGWSDCGTDHMENSIRFGWRWLDDSLEIHWFKHEHGKFSFDLIKRVSLCKEHYYELTIFVLMVLMFTYHATVFMIKEDISYTLILEEKKQLLMI